MAWDDTVTDNSSKLTAANYNAMVTDQKLRAYSADLPDGRITQTLSYTQDEERRFFKDDFTSDTSDNYTVTGTVTGWSTGTIAISQGVELLNEAEHKSIYCVFSFQDISGQNTFGIYLNNEQNIFITIYNNSEGGVKVFAYNNVTSEYLINIYNTGLTADTNAHQFGLNYISEDECYLNIDGVNYGGSFSVSGFDLNGFGIISSASIQNTYLYSISVSPSISDSDDFSVDTTARWGAVTGTTAFDTDHINLTTASGADGKGTYRRRSYLNEDGSQKIDVTLPTGVDGDFVALVTHSESADMSDGIGVGLQSDGATGWNLVTLDGTTVTEGAASGLSDADVATFEIEKDISGAYWYYIYDSTGAKPTTPTGKLFTTLKRGHTGLYCNGAGATTQTFAITDFECRCNTVVGDTNCESTEEFFFRDDFNEDSLDRYISKTANAIISDGHFLRNADYSTTYQITNDEIRYPEIHTSFSIPSGGNCTVFWGWDGTISTTWHPKNYTGIVIASNSVKLKNNVNEVVTIISESTPTISTSTEYDLKIIATSSAVTVYIDDVEVISYSGDVAYIDGYLGWQLYGNGMYFDNLQISGTRVYPTPMLRGTQVGLYNDGDEDIVCTAFSDDFEADSSGEYQLLGSPTFNSDNGLVICNDNGEGILTKSTFSDMYMSVTFTVNVDNTRPAIVFCSDNSIIANDSGNKYIVYWYIDSIRVRRVIDGVQVTIANIAYDSTIAGQVYKLSVLKCGSDISIMVDDEIIGSYVDSKYSSGYCGAGNIYNNTVNILDFQINGISPDAPNGISYCLPSVNHGGRWDTQESITQTIDMTGVVSADLKGYSSGISTLTTETKALRITAKNDTDDSSIYSDGATKYWDVTMDGTLANTRKALETNFNDMDDSVVFTHSTDSGVPDGCIYVRETICKPITVVMEADLT